MTRTHLKTSDRASRRAHHALLLGALSGALSVLALALGSTAGAVTTRRFTLDSAEDFEAGTSEGASILSTGELVAGANAARVELADVALVYSIARGPRGRVYVGTGQGGKVLRIGEDSAEEVAATGELVVTSLMFGGDGVLYAGTLPGGKVFAIDPRTNEARELAELEGAQHVWALTPREGGGVFAATGPEGKIFEVPPRGDASVYFESDAQHVMSLVGGEGGVLFAGTSDDAVVLRIEGQGRASVVHDFPGNEITALAISSDGGRLAVAANEFPAPPRVGARTEGLPQRPAAGHGRLFVVNPRGRVELVHEDSETHFTALSWTASGDETTTEETQEEPNRGGSIIVAEGRRGRVLRVDPSASGRARAVIAEVEERQVLALSLGGGARGQEEIAFGTGDSGAFYRLGRGGNDAGQWTSKVLDASFSSRFGRVAWRGSGRVRIRTRSGNRETPDDTWSEWSAPIDRAGPVRSPAARYVQIRVELGSADAQVFGLELYYLPENQRAVVTEVSLNSHRAGSTVHKLTWTVSNPDEDALRYRLAFRRESGRAWREMFGDEVQLTKTHYEWDTNGVPDGVYVARVVASDERANPAPLALRASRTSEPFRVDNHPPRIEQLSLRGDRLRGRAVDELGPIARLEIAVNGGEFEDVYPEDHLFDDASERFDVELITLSGVEEPSTVAIIAVRATDAAGHRATAEVER